MKNYGNIKKRLTLFVCLLAVTSILIAGCGGGQNNASNNSTNETQTATNKTPDTTNETSTKLENELVIATPGGAYDEAFKKHFLDEYTKATGVKVTMVPATPAEMWTKIKAMSEAGNVEWDIFNGNKGNAMLHKDLVATLTEDDIPNAKLGIEGTLADNLVMIDTAGLILAFNSKEFPEGKQPQSWEDFWNVEDFPGPRALPDYGKPFDVLAMALMADGVSPDQLYPMDLDRAFKKMDEIKSHVKVWWKSGDQSQQIMRSEEVVMSAMWDSRAKKEKQNGTPVEFTYNQGITMQSYLGILENAPHPNAAKDFLNFYLTRPEAHIGFSNEMMVGMPNKEAIEQLTEEEKKNSASANLDKMIPVVAEHPWILENQNNIIQRWNEWIQE